MFFSPYSESGVKTQDTSKLLSSSPLRMLLAPQDVPFLGVQGCPPTSLPEPALAPLHPLPRLQAPPSLHTGTSPELLTHISTHSDVPQAPGTFLNLNPSLALTSNLLLLQVSRSSECPVIYLSTQLSRPETWAASLTQSLMHFLILPPKSSQIYPCHPSSEPHHPR